MLDRLQADDKALSKELEEREDMNRKGGKPVSRIPTFHKRPTNVSQSSELPVPKKDSPVQAAPPPEKAESGIVEVTKSKPSEVRETALPLPSVRVPRVGFEPPSVFTSTEPAAATAHTPIITTPKNWSLSESLQSPSMTATPRPALRPQQDRSKTPEAEAETTPDGLASHLPTKGSLSQKMLEDAEEKHDADVKAAFTPTAPGNTEKSTETFHTTIVSQVEAIMDEEPPWEKEPMSVAGLKGSVPSSDAESEADLPEEKSEGDVLWDATEIHALPVSQSEPPIVAEKRADIDESPPPVAPEKHAKVRSASSTKVSYLFLFVNTDQSCTG